MAKLLINSPSRRILDGVSSRRSATGLASQSGRLNTWVTTMLANNPGTVSIFATPLTLVDHQRRGDHLCCQAAPTGEGQKGSGTGVLGVALRVMIRDERTSELVFAVAR
jgi:hypothetical protein